MKLTRALLRSHLCANANLDTLEIGIVIEAPKGEETVYAYDLVVDSLGAPAIYYDGDQDGSPPKLMICLLREVGNRPTETVILRAALTCANAQLDATTNFVDTLKAYRGSYFPSDVRVEIARNSGSVVEQIRRFILNKYGV